MWDDDFYDWSEEGTCEDAYEDAMSEMLADQEKSLALDAHWASLSDEERRKEELIQEIPNVIDESRMYMERLLGYTPSKNQLKKDQRYFFYYRGFIHAIKRYLLDRDLEEIVTWAGLWQTWVICKRMVRSFYQ